MRKNYTITLVLKTPMGRTIFKYLEYKHFRRSDAIADAEQKEVEFRKLGYSHAYIGNVQEWTEVWW